MSDWLKLVVSTDFVFTTIRVMTPILFAALACNVFSKGGIDAIATEGIMLLSALGGVAGSYFMKSAFMGVVAAMLVGILTSLLFGVITLDLKSEAILAGIAINTFASGFTVFMVYLLTGSKGSSQSLNNKVVPNLHIPLVKDIPVVGEVLSGHNILTYTALLLVVVLAWFLYKTPAGLRIRSIGENRNAAQSVGINVRFYQNTAMMVAGSLAGLGGAFMSMAYVSFFSRDMIAGRGFIGMAAESMGKGTPVGILVSSAFFGIADSLAVRMQALEVAPQLIQLLPYTVTIIAIAIYSYIGKKKKHATSKKQN